MACSIASALLASLGLLSTRPIVTYGKLTSGGGSSYRRAGLPSTAFTPASAIAAALMDAASASSAFTEFPLRRWGRCAHRHHRERRRHAAHGCPRLRASAN